MCARMFPAREEDLYPKTPKVERFVYQALKTLPDGFVVFHSAEWAKRNTYSKHFSFFENDFLLLHPHCGILIIELKGGNNLSRDMRRSGERDPKHRPGFVARRHLHAGKAMREPLTWASKTCL